MPVVLMFLEFLSQGSFYSCHDGAGRIVCMPKAIKFYDILKYSIFLHRYNLSLFPVSFVGIFMIIQNSICMFHEAKAIDVVGHVHGWGFTCFPYTHFYIFLFMFSNLHRKKRLHSIKNSDRVKS